MPENERLELTILKAKIAGTFELLLTRWLVGAGPAQLGIILCYCLEVKVTTDYLWPLCNPFPAKVISFKCLSPVHSYHL